VQVTAVELVAVRETSMPADTVLTESPKDVPTVVLRLWTFWMLQVPPLFRQDAITPLAQRVAPRLVVTLMNL
jgi:hypothetical protein